MPKSFILTLSLSFTLFDISQIVPRVIDAIVVDGWAGLIAATAAIVKINEEKLMGFDVEDLMMGGMASCLETCLDEVVFGQVSKKGRESERKIYFI